MIGGDMADDKPLAAIVRSSDRVAERQREGTYHGDEDQIAAVERYCSSRRLTFELLPPELDISGGKPIEERPALRAAIEGVERGAYSGIVTANLKRLTRSRSGLAIWERVEAAGGHVHTAAENIDTSTPNGRFMRDVFLAEAVREREEHAERYAERRRKTVEAGIWRQRQVPAGYRFAGPAVDGRYRGTARRLVPGPDANRVRWAFRARAAGASISEVARRLDMTTSGARQLLRNRVYRGELRDGEHVNPEAHEPLVTEQEWRAAQPTAVARPSRMGGEPALLAGLVRCCGCGHVMSRTNTRALVYSCHGRSSAGRCPAPAAITLRLLDEHVETIALDRLSRLRGAVSRDDSKLRRAQANLETAERELAAYLEGVQAAGLDPEEFASAVRGRRDAVAAARRVRDEARTVEEVPLDGDPVTIWRQLNAHQRNRLLRRLFEAVLVQRAGGRGRLAPVADRVRVLRHGAGVVVDVPRARDMPLPIMSIPLLAADDERVAGVELGEDSL
jgi:site-specific DNA recombinase